MRTIPCDERSITDEELFSAFDLNYPGLEGVRAALGEGDLGKAKKEPILHGIAGKPEGFLPVRRQETDAAYLRAAGKGAQRAGSGSGL